MSDRATPRWLFHSRRQLDEARGLLEGESIPFEVGREESIDGELFLEGAAPWAVTVPEPDVTRATVLLGPPVVAQGDVARGEAPGDDDDTDREADVVAGIARIRGRERLHVGLIVVTLVAIVLWVATRNSAALALGVGSSVAVVASGFRRLAARCPRCHALLARRMRPTRLDAFPLGRCHRCGLRFDRVRPH